MLLTEEQAKAIDQNDDDDDLLVNGTIVRVKRQAAIGNGFPKTQWTVGQAIPYSFGTITSKKKIIKTF